MTIGWYAPLVVLAALILFFAGELVDSIGVGLFFSLFGGGAAFTIGSASIQPLSFFLLFLVAQALLLLVNRGNHVGAGLKTNGFLAFFCIYGAITAIILPRLFARTMALPPMQLNKRDLYYVSILVPSKQNLTTAAYLLGTLLASICAGAAAASPRSRRVVVNWSILVSWMHIGFGILGVIAMKAGAMSIIGFFRNAKYAELDETTSGLVRITGIDPEPSTYGGYAFIWFVFMTELWLRQVKPKWTGLTAGALLIMLILCTSSSAYFALAVYALILLVRWVLAPGSFKVVKIATVAMGGLSAVCLILALCAFVPKFAAVLGTALANMTVHKLGSTSGMARSFWIKEGVVAFVKSYGLGVGAGSFRCSSLLIAIMGSMGVIGTAAFAGHVLTILRPLKASTYRTKGDEDRIGPATAWAACGALIPPMVSASGPEPGFVFALLGGLALGWRALALREQRARGRAVVAAPAPLAVQPEAAAA